VSEPEVSAGSGNPAAAAVSEAEGRAPKVVRSVLIALGALAVVIAFVIVAALPENRAPVTYRFTIPLGTAQQLAAGANISLFPERLVINKGDVIDLVNHDDQNDEVGPFFVPANGELRQSVNRPGTYSGTCTLHRSGRVVIVVR